jgi:hypothetical protein
LEGKEVYTAKDLNNMQKALIQAEWWWAKGKALNPRSTMGSAARAKMQALIDKMEASRAGPRPVSGAETKDSDVMAGKFESFFSSALEKLEGRAATPPPPPAPTALEQALTTVLAKMNSQEAPPPPPPPSTGPAPGKMEVSMEEYTTLKAEKIAAEKLVEARKGDHVDAKEERQTGRTETKELMGHLVDMAKGALKGQHTMAMGMALTPSLERSRPRPLRPPSSQGSEYYEEYYEDQAPAPAPSLLNAPQPMPALLPPGGGAPQGAPLTLMAAPPGGGAHSLLAKVQAIRDVLQIAQTQPKVALMEAATQMGMSTEGPLPALADALIAALGITL